MNVSVDTDVKLRELCKLKFAIYADQVRTRKSARDDSASLMLTLYHETIGGSPFDHEFVVQRAVDQPEFHVVAHTPSWRGPSRFYGNSMEVRLPSKPERFGGNLAVSGCLAPWLSEYDPHSHTHDMVGRIIEKMGVSTASPGEPFTQDWIPDNLAREAAYQAGRIPEEFRAWR